MSLRSRLLLASLATLAVGLGAMLVIGNVLLDQRVRAEASDVLRANANAQLSALTVTGRGVAVRATINDGALDRRSWVLDGSRVIERPPAVSAALDRAAVALGRTDGVREADGPAETRLRASPVHAPGSQRMVGAVVVAFSTESLEHLQKQVLLGSIVIALMVLLAGGLTIRAALQSALRPVSQMTASAREWGAHDLNRRFDLGPASDELTSLAATLDGLLARIAASRRHEQRFAGEMAHELRTPLAGLLLQAELALQATGPSAEQERREALEAVVAHSSRLARAIDSLLAIARQEIDPAVGTVDVVALAQKLEGVEVSAPGDLPLAEGDPEVVHRALAPLVENARRYARSQVRLELSTRGGRVRIEVHDDGPGLDPSLRRTVFDPGVRGPGASADGAGLGLALARRLARSCGGEVTAGPGPGGCFILELPALGPRDT